MFDAKLEPKEMNALKVDGTVDVSKRNEQNSSTASVQVNAPVNAPITIGAVSSDNKEKVDIAEAARNWVQSIDRLGITPPFVMGRYKESEAEKHDILVHKFVEYIDRNYDELPDKKTLYEILDKVKAELK